MNATFRIFSYLKYLFASGNEHGIHSPFIFQLYTKVIRLKKEYYCFLKIEQLREKLKTNKTRIEVQDYGTGNGQKNRQRRIKKIAKQSLKSAAIGKLLFRIVGELQPLTIVELGTSMGITTAYLASANSKSSVYTFEGCPNIAQIAEDNFRKLDLKNIKIQTGNIDQTLEFFIKNQNSIDLAFIDANHTYQATMTYFEILEKYSAIGAAIIIDDIYWSGSMNRAWKTIIQKSTVTLSIDLYDIGIVFLNKNQPKQHFILRK